jgi:2-methylisocitrate lyase-like PEP mutase family enzyme
MRLTTADKRAPFRQLHAGGCFLIPNPWDVGSARWLQGLGFAALASTSSGMAWSQGAADNRITRQQALDHLRALVDATDVPVNADFENGVGDSPEAVADSVRLAVATGVAGLLARSAWAGFQRAAQSLVDGRFDGFTGAASGAGLNGFFGPDAERR